MSQDCSHLEMIQDVTPSSPDQCLQCVEMGDVWVNLRLCMICGQVGCCDNSKNTHATKHFHSDGHGIIKSHQPGEEWYWCYVDDVMFQINRIRWYPCSVLRPTKIFRPTMSLPMNW